MSSTSSTSPPHDVVSHIFITLLGCDADTVKAVRKRGVRGFRAAVDADVEPYVDNNVLFRTEADMWRLWQQVARLEHWTRASDAIAFTADQWDALDSREVHLRTAHMDAKLKAAHPSTTPGPTTKGPPHPAPSSSDAFAPEVTAATVTPSQVMHTNFLKYGSFSVSSLDEVSSFYQNLCAQALQYNIFIREYADYATRGDTAIPDEINPAIATKQATTLYTKLCQTDVIASTFTIARKLLTVTRDGHVFLTELLRLVHPVLSLASISASPIPRFSTSNCLFTYASEVILYLEKHALKSRKFDPIERTHMFLDNLDDPSYSVQVTTCRTAIMLSKSVPQEYSLPTIATTFTTFYNDGHPLSPSTAEANTVATAYDTARTSISGLTSTRATVNTVNQPDVNESDEGYSDDDEPMCCRVYRPGGGRSPYARNQVKGNNRGGFRGTCHACGMKNHHSKDCYFLQKLRMALSFLNVNPKFPQTIRNWKGKNNFKTNEARVRSLMEAKFIPYSDAPPSVFVSAVDDSPDIFEPSDPQSE